MYHEIDTSHGPPSETVITLDRFRQQMLFLADHHYHPLTVPEFLGFLRGQPVPKNSVLLTFDDGWKSQAAAAALLQHHKFHAIFFIITGAADGNFGPDYLSWEQIQTLARDPLFDFGSHSVTHPWAPHNNFLTWVSGENPGKSIDSVQLELTESKKNLEQHLHRPVTSWAWPCGWTTPELTREAQAAGYEAQFNTYDRTNTPGGSPAEIRRYFVNGTWDIDAFADFLTRTTKAPDPAAATAPVQHTFLPKP